MIRAAIAPARAAAAIGVTAGRAPDADLSPDPEGEEKGKEHEPEDRAGPERADRLVQRIDQRRRREGDDGAQQHAVQPIGFRQGQRAAPVAEEIIAFELGGVLIEEGHRMLYATVRRGHRLYASAMPARADRNRRIRPILRPRELPAALEPAAPPGGGRPGRVPTIDEVDRSGRRARGRSRRRRRRGRCSG